MPVTVEPPQRKQSVAVEIDSGVIEEARRRQRRRHAAGAVSAVALAILIAALLIGGGKGGSGAAGDLSARPLKLTLVHGRAFSGGQPALMGVAPSLQAGNVGVCIAVVGSEGCNGPLPTAAYPAYGGGGGFSPEEKVGPGGEIDAIFTGPGVAAMRVAHLGTFKAESAPGLPPGAKQIAFYRPPDSRGSVLPPGSSPQALQGFEHGRQGPALTETLLNGTGHAIPVKNSRGLGGSSVGGSSVFTLPNSYWQGTQTPPVQGRCAMRSTLPGVRTAWGQVATEIAGDTSIIAPGWLTCLHTWFTLDGSNYETAVLLNGRSPGKPPAMLWGAIPIPGHPGVVQIPPVQREIHFSIPKRSPAQVAREIARDTKRVGRARAEEDVRPAEQLSGKATFWEVFIPPTVARRVGPAWVLVRYGSSLAQRIAFLQGLHVTLIRLGHR